MESFFQPILIALTIFIAYTKLAYTLVTTTFTNRLIQVRCEKDGKEFLTWCDKASYTCTQKFSDAGSVCSITNLHCQGFCIHTKGTQGICSEYPMPKQTYDSYKTVAPENRLNTSGKPTIDVPLPCAIP